MTIDELFILAEVVKKRGDLLFIKLDGEREENYFTVLISYISKTDKDLIRRDGDNLKELLSEVLGIYYRENNL